MHFYQYEYIMKDITKLVTAVFLEGSMDGHTEGSCSCEKLFGDENIFSRLLF